LVSSGLRGTHAEALTEPRDLQQLGDATPVGGPVLLRSPRDAPGHSAPLGCWGKDSVLGGLRGGQNECVAAQLHTTLFHGDEGESEYDGETALRALHDATHTEQEEEE
jgi:hypothetical protein